MADSRLDKYRDEDAAYDFLERHLWPMGAVCPNCGVSDRIGRLQGKSTRVRTYKCYACRKPFTVKIGTPFYDSHIPLHKWLQAIALMVDDPSVTPSQISRTIDVTFKTAVGMLVRIKQTERGSQR